MWNARRTILCLVLMVICLAAGGCSSDKGSREYQPGKGWVPA